MAFHGQLTANFVSFLFGILIKQTVFRWRAAPLRKNIQLGGRLTERLCNIFEDAILRLLIT